MASMDLAAAERAAICDTLERLGPDAPTLCEGWTTADLVAHLVVRENDVLAGPGILLPRLFGSLTDKRMAAAKKRGFAANVATVRRGRGIVMKLAPAVVDVAEFYIHDEDCRRPNGEGPRPVEAEREDALWSWVARLGRAFARKVDAGVRIETPDGRSRDLKGGDKVVVLRGPASELVLYLTGRRDAAKVEVAGDAEAIAALERAQLSL
ncbi:MAG TPA: TIGR03085 family metal-binding protein [Acidimicrobiales bacterium]|nr:TIGR03085 family metal-binding protein [Acidimicrobiales bacterium]